MSEIIKTNWNNKSDEYFSKDLDCYDAIIQNPEKAFPAAVYPLIKKYIGDLHGKKVLVPSSGDNIGAFGLCLLGAKVLSCDIAEKQLENAKLLANKYNLKDIEFVCQDSMTLEKIADNAYDLVYTSNGVHVWIDNIRGMYENIFRVLKPGGHNIFFETHPMIRPFDNTTYEIKVKKLYEDIEPHGNDVTYAWRTQDFVNAVTSAGFYVKEMQEFHSVREDLKSHNYLYSKDDEKINWPEDTFDWKVNPWAALPQCLFLCSQKK